ncbi:MAG: glycogen synthase GlgA [Opitutales bacterium]
MKIVHATSECFPFIKTGGLADAVGSVTRALAGYGHEVAVFLPGYRVVLEHPQVAGAEKILSFGVEMGDSLFQGDVRRVKLGKNLTLYLICRDEYFDRTFPYGTSDRDYDDNPERFTFFSKAIVEVLIRLRLKPEVVHCHDWQTSLLPLFLRFEERRQALTLAGKTVLTIHNLAFQGLFPMHTFGLTNLPDELLGIDGFEYYGQINWLKGGILFSDRITTVSPTYAREILTPEFGCGLEGVLAKRSDDLVSLINGIDQDVWDPKNDPYLPAPFSAADPKGKEACRHALLKECGFSPRFNGLLFGMICRFTEQKGIRLLLEARDFFLRKDVRLVLLGSGPHETEKRINDFAALNPKGISVFLRLDEAMSHRIEAGCDFFLMPSTFEPCGLNQMYSQRYGTIPVASRIGGLADTIIDVDEDPQHGTGITFYPPRKEALLDALTRAQALHADKDRLAATRRRAMKADFSWRKAVRAYEALYRTIV